MGAEKSHIAEATTVGERVRRPSAGAVAIRAVEFQHSNDLWIGLNAADGVIDGGKVRLDATTRTGLIHPQFAAAAQATGITRAAEKEALPLRATIEEHELTRTVAVGKANAAFCAAVLNGLGAQVVRPNRQRGGLCLGKFGTGEHLRRAVHSGKARELRDLPYNRGAVTGHRGVVLVADGIQRPRGPSGVGENSDGCEQEKRAVAHREGNKISNIEREGENFRRRARLSPKQQSPSRTIHPPDYR